MTVDDAEKVMKMLEMHGPRLREAGYSHIELEGVGKFDLAPFEPETDDDKEDDEDFFVDPLNDPKTFGRKRGVPRLIKREQ